MRQVRKCKFCGKEFVVRSGVQKYCCEECQSKAKEARKKRQQNFINAIEPVIGLQHQEYLTFAKAAILMGCSRQYVYKLVNEGKLEASRISSRMAFIRKADIEKMLTGNPYHRVLPTSIPKKCKETATKSAKAKNGMSLSKSEDVQQENEVLDYISGEEVMALYKVKKTWLYTTAKRNQVPVCRIAGMNYYSRKHLDLLFGLTVEASEVKEWITAKDAEVLYGMKPSGLHACAYRHHIPTKREYGQTYYAKEQLDALRRTDLVNDERYFTAKEAAEKYGMTTSNIGVIVKKNGIATIKVGVKNLIPKADFDKIMEERMAQYGSYHIF
ncbi:MAG: helix-turn-helix domain-containing protein [Bacteroidaceae bacterium]|nr:helix-turn-helix domain-containing protein [Bacteroidaceae bacterium]